MTMNLATLADEMGRLTVEKAEIEKRIKAIKAELVELGETVEGNEFVATYVAGSTRWTLDTKAVAAEMGDDWVTARSKLTNVAPTVRIARKLAA